MSDRVLGTLPYYQLNNFQKIKFFNEVFNFPCYSELKKIVETKIKKILNNIAERTYYSLNDEKLIFFFFVSFYKLLIGKRVRKCVVKYKKYISIRLSIKIKEVIKFIYEIYEHEWRLWRVIHEVLNIFFCPPAGKRQLPGRCAKRSCRFPAPSSRKIVY